LWSEQLPEIPSLIYTVLMETKQQQVKQRFDENRANSYRETTHNFVYFIGGAIVAVLLIGGMYLL
jgi:hypothetical protein